MTTEETQKEDQNPLAGDALSPSKSDALSLSKWEEKKLGEVCEILDRLRKPITKKDRITGEYPYYGATGILSYVDSYIFSEKLVLIGEDGAKWQSGDNTAFIVDGKYWVNNHAHVIRPDRKIILDDWIVYYLNFSDLTSFITGVTVPKLNQEKMRDIDIPLPPLSEQKRIVAILDEAFEAIARAKENTEQNLKNAKEIFESYLQLALTPPQGYALSLSKSDALSPSKCDALSLSKWEEKKLGEIGIPKMCKRIFKEQTKTEGDIPFYKIGTFGKEPDAFISREIYDEFRSKYSFPKKGDVLISASGTIGRRVKYNGEPAYFQDSNIVWIDNNEEQVLNDFLFEFYGACNWGSTKGATISRLYNDNLKNINIVFPKSLKEQQSIVHQLDALRTETQKLEEIYAQKLNDLEELKKSLLQKAFAGELVK